MRPSPHQFGRADHRRDHPQGEDAQLKILFKPGPIHHKQVVVGRAVAKGRADGPEGGAVPDQAAPGVEVPQRPMPPTLRPGFGRDENSQPYNAKKPRTLPE